jgi:hypothetical protein
MHSMNFTKYGLCTTYPAEFQVYLLDFQLSLLLLIQKCLAIYLIEVRIKIIKNSSQKDMFWKCSFKFSITLARNGSCICSRV